MGETFDEPLEDIVAAINEALNAQFGVFQEDPFGIEPNIAPPTVFESVISFFANPFATVYNAIAPTIGLPSMPTLTDPFAQTLGILGTIATFAAPPGVGLGFTAAAYAAQALSEPGALAAAVGALGFSSPDQAATASQEAQAAVAQEATQEAIESATGQTGTSMSDLSGDDQIAVNQYIADGLGVTS
ncbi:MAG: hypothetical protein HYT98_02820, partial [Candidatus Sungbacteria bacterium]|nr:hypothetical protein [Candidatus Sungbacteria bacterium]